MQRARLRGGDGGGECRARNRTRRAHTRSATDGDAAANNDTSPNIHINTDSNGNIAPNRHANASTERDADDAGQCNIATDSNNDQHTNANRAGAQGIHDL